MRVARTFILHAGCCDDTTGGPLDSRGVARGRAKDLEKLDVEECSSGHLELWLHREVAPASRASGCSTIRSEMRKVRLVPRAGSLEWGSRMRDATICLLNFLLCGHHD